MTKEEIAKILKKLREESGLTQKKVAEMVGKKQQTIASWETGQSQPDANMLFVLCRTYGVTVSEAFGFESEDNNEELLSKRENIELIKKINSLDSFGKETVSMIIERELERTNQLKKRDDVEQKENIIYLPEMYSRFSAGTGQPDFDSGSDMVGVPYSPEAASANYIITVSGDSMEPDFSNGDRVYIKSMPDINIGEIGAWQVNNELYIKEKGKRELISINPDYDNVKIGEFDTASCLGKVLGKVD